MKVINLFLISEIVGIIGLIIYFMSDYSYRTNRVCFMKKSSYFIRQLCSLFGIVYAPYMLILSLIVVITCFG